MRTTPAPDPFQEGERYFRAGDYGRAVEAYQTYLRESSSHQYDEHVLFRLALSYLIPSSPLRDPAKAQSFLQRLSVRFPDSPYRVEVEIIGDFQEQIGHLNQKITNLQNQIAENRAGVERLTRQLDEAREDSRKLGQEKAQLQAHLDLRQKRIESLTRELEKEKHHTEQLEGQLEKLKQIDLQKRPPP